jgi:cation efflux system membrane fusion protein
VVDADGKPLAFVKSGTTYDPVFLQTGASQGDQIAITDGSISPGDDVVTQGALSLPLKPLLRKPRQRPPQASTPW